MLNQSFTNEMSDLRHLFSLGSKHKIGYVKKKYDGDVLTVCSALIKSIPKFCMHEILSIRQII